MLAGAIGKRSHALFATSLRSLLATRTSMSTQPPSSNSPGPVEQSIRNKAVHARRLTHCDTQLVAQLQPSDLTISNDSWQHRHHAPMRAQGGGNGETHFSINIVSDAFKGKTTMQRHRIVYSALSEELAAGLHALSLKTKTEEEVLKAGP